MDPAGFLPEQPKRPQTESERRAQEQTIRGKVSCDKAVHEMQMRLVMDDVVPDDVLELAADMLQPEHYDDVVCERGIGGTCGFPGCGEPIKKKHSNATRKYHVSLSEHKARARKRTTHARGRVRRRWSLDRHLMAPFLRTCVRGRCTMPRPCATSAAEAARSARRRTWRASRRCRSSCARARPGRRLRKRRWRRPSPRHRRPRMRTASLLARPRSLRGRSLPPLHARQACRCNLATSLSMRSPSALATPSRDRRSHQLGPTWWRATPWRGDRCPPHQRPWPRLRRRSRGGSQRWRRSVMARDAGRFM